MPGERRARLKALTRLAGPAGQGPFARPGIRPVLTAQGPFAAQMVLAGAAGLAADRLGLVGGWLIGALLAVLAASRLGLRPAFPWSLRSAALSFSGILTGATITPATMAAAGEIGISILMLLLFTAAVTGASYLVQTRGWGTGPATAFYAAWPGNTILALIAAERSGADLDRVVFIQSARLFILVVLVPLMIGTMHAAVPPGAGAWDLQLALAVAVAIGCNWLARRTGILGGEMFITAIAIGALSYAGWLEVRLPGVLISVFQVIVGAFIGVSLARCTRAAIRAALWPAAASSAVAAAMTFAFALPVAAWVGMSPAALVLAYAPGGAEPMILLSAVFGVDPGFVGIHHTLRLVSLTLLFPLVARIAARHGQRGRG